MKRHLLLGGLGLLPAMVLAQTAEPNEPDARLDKPVAAKLPFTTIPAALKALGTQTGVPLEAATAVSNLKATVLVKDQPLKTVMARMADVFHGTWTRVGDGYRFSIPADWLSQTSTFRDRDDRERRKEAEAAIAGYVKQASVPYAQARTSPAFSPESYAVGALFRGASQRDLNSFWNGQPARYTLTVPAEGTAATAGPGTTNPSRGRGTRGGADAPPMQLIRVTVIYDPITARLVVAGAGRGGAERPGPLVDGAPPAASLLTTPFGKELTEWPKFDAENKAFATSANGKPPAGPWFGGASSMGDQLAWLHDQTGVSIVADAFRLPASTNVRGGTAAALLQSIAQANRAYLRSEGGFAMLRHPAFWRLRVMETPESTFAKLEGKTAPTLDDYASFAGLLTPAQELPFRVRNGVLLKVDPEPLRVGMSALKFYAALGSGQRQRALAGGAIGASEMGGSLGTLYLNALEDPFGGQPIGRGANANNPSALGFLVTQTTTSGAVARPAYRFLFGTSPTDGIQYVVPIR